MQRNNIEIAEFDGKAKTIFPLAKVYMNSYNELSKTYKSEEEMSLYIYGSFVKKLKKYSLDKDSSVYVLNVDGEPKGFVRYSPIPDYYKSPQEGMSKEVENGYMDGYEFSWQRKVHFSDGNEGRLNHGTLAINQIYLDPSVQNQGFGTMLLKKTLPKVREKGFDNIIIEYNRNNKNAKRFYAHVLGLGKIADTKDLDHIKNNKLFISDVEIGHNTIDNALTSIRKIENKRYKEPMLPATSVHKYPHNE